MKRLNENGQILLEMILAVAIVAVIIFLVSQLTFVSLRGQKSGGEQSTASRLGQEEIEIARSVMASSWTDIFNSSKGVDYYASRQVSPTRFIFTTGQEIITISGIPFTRKVQFFNICRDSSTGDIVSFTSSVNCSSNILDSSTLQVNLNVTWATSQSVSWSEYLTRSLSNRICRQSDWSGGAGAGTQSDASACAGWTTYNSATNINTGTVGLIKLQ
ncbi:MAG: hypothetical protein HYV52_01415 [Parcubacteria group bacterium]|nr:hypothetical protein [Parcubacteria group bacterium]